MAGRFVVSLTFAKDNLDKATVAFVVANENQNTKDLAADIPNSFRAEAPYNNLIGPTQPRAGSNGSSPARSPTSAAWSRSATRWPSSSTTRPRPTTPA